MPQNIAQFQILPTTGRSAETVARRHGHKSLTDLAHSLPRGAQVVDVGAGASAFGKEVARLRPDIHWTNVDFSYHDKRILHDVQQNAPPNLTFVAGDVTELDIFVEPASMDAVFSYWLLPHLSLHDEQTARTAAMQLYTAAKPGGTLAVGPRLRSIHSLGGSWRITKDGTLTAEAYSREILRQTRLSAISRSVRRAFNAGVFDVFGISRYIKGNSVDTWQVYDPKTKKYIPPYHPRAFYLASQVGARVMARLCRGGGARDD